jgi:alpha,alpha-trehalose phosphorylase
VASLAGAWIAAVAGLGGMRDYGGSLSFAPKLPERLTRLAFRLCFRGRRLKVEFDHREARYLLLRGSPLDITHHGTEVTVSEDQPVTCPVPTPSQREAPSQPPGREPVQRRPPS